MRSPEDFAEMASLQFNGVIGLLRGLPTELRKRTLDRLMTALDEERKLPDL